MYIAEEFQEYYDKFIFNKCIIYPQKSKIDYSDVIKALEIMKPLEYPDAYTYMNDTLYIFEHFRIDGTYHKKHKGNRVYRQLIDNEKEYKDFCNKNIDNGLFSRSISVDVNSKNYMNNLLEIFKKHYNQIENYKKHLIKHLNLNNEVIVKTIFLIEDISPYGTYAFKNGIKQVVLPVFCNEFIKEVQNLNHIDYFLCSCKLDNDGFINKSDIDKINEFNKEKYINYLINRTDLIKNNLLLYNLLDKKILSINGIELGFNVFIPIKNK